MSTIRVTCLQLGARPESMSHDDWVAHVAAMTSEVEGSDLIVLPEMWHVGYFGFDEYRAEAVSPEGELARLFSGIAADLRTTVHLGSVVEDGSGLHNTSLVFGPDGEEVGRYRKIHVFGYGSREQELLEAGSEVVSFPLRGHRAGMATCYDLRFPELFRAMVDEISLYVVPAAWPAARIQHWSALLVARAIENQAFVIGCNAAGVDRGVELGGCSAVIAPSGEVLARAGSEPGRLEVEVDLDEPGTLRSTFRALGDRFFAVPKVPDREG